MAIGLVGKKCGMTRVFTEDGASVPVTVIEALPNRITRVRTPESDGYSALQVTSGARKPSRVSKADSGQYAVAGTEIGEGLWEFRADGDELEGLEAGGEITVERFEALRGLGEELRELRRVSAVDPWAFEGPVTQRPVPVEDLGVGVGIGADRGHSPTDHRRGVRHGPGDIDRPTIRCLSHRVPDRGAGDPGGDRDDAVRPRDRDDPRDLCDRRRLHRDDRRLHRHHRLGDGDPGKEVSQDRAAFLGCLDDDDVIGAQRPRGDDPSHQG